MTPEQVIKRPIVLTEKAATLKEDANQVIFEVELKANKNRNPRRGRKAIRR